MALGAFVQLHSLYTHGFSRCFLQGKLGHSPPSPEEQFHGDRNQEDQLLGPGTSSGSVVGKGTEVSDTKPFT